MADLGNLAWERPLVADLGSLAQERPLVANMGRLRAKRALLIWPSEARHQIRGDQKGAEPPFLAAPRPSGRGHYIIIGLDQLLTTRTECILTEIHDTAQLGILPEICIRVGHSSLVKLGQTEDD